MANFIVDILIDENDGNVSAGDLSLREALSLASAGDTITFDSSLASLDAGFGLGTIGLQLGALLVDQAVTITGLGADSLTISGENLSRVFTIDDGNSNTLLDVSISGLTIANGNTQGAGGGIFNREALALSNSTVSNNTAADAGGGIANDLGTLTLTNSVITSNTAAGTGSGNFPGVGGGLFNRLTYGSTDYGTVQVIDSTISNNTAAVFGGGIFNAGTSFDITGSTISGNTAGDRGGGIFNSDYQLTVANSTISGNAANGSGGGIYNFDDLSVTGSTITGNTADSDGNGTGNGGGIATQVYANTVITDSTIAGNGAAPNTADPGVIDANISGPYVDGGNNTIGGPGAGPFTSLTVDTLVDEDDGDYSAGDLSLREALKLLESGGTIDFDAQLVNQDIGLGLGVLELTYLDNLGEVTIDKSVTITGLGADSLSIGGLLTIEDSGSNTVSDVVISDLDIVSIKNYGADNLTLTNVVVGSIETGFFNPDAMFTANNIRTGGITNYYGNVAIYDSLITNGIGIDNIEGDVLVSGTTISGNTSTQDGGGIYSFAGAVEVINSTITNNSANGVGGGIYARGSITITDSIISSNTGGGLYVRGNGTLIDSSVIDNTGGGVTLESGSFTQSGSTIANNTPYDIIGVNRPPVAADDAYSLDEDTSLVVDINASILLNDSDPDIGDGSSIIANLPFSNVMVDVVAAPQFGSLILSRDGTFTYTPDANFNGTDSFTYRFDDGSGGSDTATVSLTVNPINDAPTAIDDVAATLAGNSVAIHALANDIDIDGDALTINAVSAAANGSVVINPDGTLTYTPNAGFSGTDSFSYTLSDGSLSDTATVSITVEPPQPDTIGEYGTIDDLNHQWQTITLDHSYINPVVIVSDPSLNGSDPAAVRLQNVTANSFDIQLQEPKYRDTWHINESVSYIVIEAGDWTLADGTRISAGNRDTNRLTSSSSGFSKVDLTGFDTTPTILSQVQTANGSDWVVTRTRNLSNNGFSVAMQEEEALNNGSHVTETIGWLAIDQGIASDGDTLLQGGTTDRSVNHKPSNIDFQANFDVAPALIAKLSSWYGSDTANLRLGSISNTGFNVQVYEEKSLDNEITHTTEAVSFLALDTQFGTLSGFNI